MFVPSHTFRIEALTCLLDRSLSSERHPLETEANLCAAAASASTPCAAAASASTLCAAAAAGLWGCGRQTAAAEVEKLEIEWRLEFGGTRTSRSLTIPALENPNLKGGTMRNKISWAPESESEERGKKE